MKGHALSFLCLPSVLSLKKTTKQEKSTKRLRSRLHAQKAGTGAGDTAGCSLRGCSVTAPPPTWLTGVVFHVHLLLPCSSTPSQAWQNCCLVPGKHPSQTSCCQSNKGPDKPCICICIERHFQRHSQGNSLAAYRCYLRMTTIQVILQLHYLSVEIRLVYIFTRIISFKSADYIRCTSEMKSLRFTGKSFNTFHRNHLPQAPQNQKSLKPKGHVWNARAHNPPSDTANEKGCKGTHGNTCVQRLCHPSLLLSYIG